jgi:hypothetical protein
VIRLPARSVTRFFIPLIDVMVLLFCIFLLIPAAAPDPLADSDRPTPGPESATGAEAVAAAARLDREVRSLRREVAQIRREKDEVLTRLAVQVLEIDAATGRLYEPGPERVEIDSEARAAALIDRLRRRAGDRRELYVLFLYPRGPSAYPTQGQIDRYQGWFASVPHGFDNPLTRGE